MTKCIEIQMTEFSECYAMVDADKFKVGPISDLSGYPGGKRTYGKPFVEIACDKNDDPAILFHLWAKVLGEPAEPRCPFCGQLFKEVKK